MALTILLSHKDGVIKCQIAQDGRYLRALTVCCQAPFDKFNSDAKTYICSNCKGEGSLHHWNDTGRTMPPSYYLHDAERFDWLGEWLMKWTGITKAMDVKVSWS